MTRGEQSAKQTMYAEAMKMAERLESGNGADVAEIGRALAFLIRMLEAAVTTEFVTHAELPTLLAAHRQGCPVYQAHAQRKPIRISLGPVSWQGSLSLVGCTALAFVFFVGKGKGWW